ncbi:MAG: hypothetical protein LIO79_08185 [Rikenellaceae bacterium]|nr:hypothetical protein [Rikenellaceae bacterium]
MGEKIKKYLKPLLNVAYAFGAILLPSLISLLIALFTGNLATFWHDCYKCGEFIIYGVGLLSTSTLIMIVCKIKKILWCIIPLLFFSLMYVIIMTLRETNAFVDNNVLIWCSIIAVITSVIISYYSHYLQQKTPPDISEQRRGEQEELSSKLS